MAKKKRSAKRTSGRGTVAVLQDERKRFDARKYILVFILALIIFISGLIIGSYMSSRKLSDVQDLQETLRTDTLDIELQYELLEKDPCGFVNTTPLSEQLYDIAIRLDYMEGLLGKDDENVLRLKKYYSLLEMRQWLFEKQVIEVCSMPKDLILYFYSNEEGVCDDCEEQGFILSYLRKKYGRQLSIYSFDYELDSQAIVALRRRFGITIVPSLIINGALHEGFMRTSDIEAELTIIEEPLAPEDEIKNLLLNATVNGTVVNE